MLVLTRRSGESVRIGADIRVTVIAASGGQVRLGIEAPESVPVHRQEIYERIARANLAAAQLPDDVLAQLPAAPGPLPVRRDEAPGESDPNDQETES